MYAYIEERVMNVAEYIVEHEATVRAAASKFGTKPMYIGMRLAAAYGAGDIRWIYCVKYRLYQSTHGCFR